MESLTDRQRKVLDIIEEFKDKTGFEPSLTAVAKRLKIGMNGVVGHLKALERKGYIRKFADNRGVYQLVRKFEESGKLEIPLVADIAAGIAKEVYETRDETLSLSAESFGRSVVALRVSGQSMIEDGIFDGDFVLVSTQTKEMNSKNIFAVRVKNTEVTLKRLKKADKETVELVPSNKSFKVVKVPIREVEIVGKMVGLVRRM